VSTLKQRPVGPRWPGRTSRRAETQFVNSGKNEFQLLFIDELHIHPAVCGSFFDIECYISLLLS
jgi:hypothetical protein